MVSHTNIEPVHGQHLVNFCQTDLSAYGLARARRYYLELNWHMLDHLVPFTMPPLRKTAAAETKVLSCENPELKGSPF